MTRAQFCAALAKALTLPEVTIASPQGTLRFWVKPGGPVEVWADPLGVVQYARTKRLTPGDLLRGPEVAMGLGFTPEEALTLHQAIDYSEGELEADSNLQALEWRRALLEVLGGNVT